eukprot:COSAG01_NODE_340_length_18638_cov_56.516505_15_plen_262_part_00
MFAGAMEREKKAPGLGAVAVAVGGCCCCSAAAWLLVPRLAVGAAAATGGDPDQRPSMTLVTTLLLLSAAAATAPLTTAHTATPAANPSMGCQAPDSARFPFCDERLPIDTRVADLVMRIGNDTAAKAQMLTARDPLAFPELAATPGYYWGTNCVQSVENCAHGVAKHDCPENGTCVVASDGTERCSTKFPSPPGMHAAFNRSLVRQMAGVFATEIRALFNIGRSRGVDCWGPVINIARDPRSDQGSAPLPHAYGCTTCARA